MEYILFFFFFPPHKIKIICPKLNIHFNYDLSALFLLSSEKKYYTRHLLIQHYNKTGERFISQSKLIILLQKLSSQKYNSRLPSSNLKAFVTHFFHTMKKKKEIIKIITFNNLARTKSTKSSI